ncbi:toll/interleukin-1 receptor domain-containing protein [Abyssibius alkaniclasticus]|uniref:toll/interleukin-1 receptor domain-containing protein n=1 Tax=Abyssibius alkaniclasticus TaxID=2881234 RepID=UPI002363A1EC|nr:toll/interleukin-1 receptor domain-containing protein [Abyssibius alkaniclasticus]UPH70755.1 toll/interleukin-1 receptor domain-containing protein [Abyssibius alkaniclasticus]
MALTPSERVTYKTEIAHRLSPLSWAEVDVILGEFGADTAATWNSDLFSYVVTMIKGLSDGPLQQLANHLNIETGEDSVADPPKFWTEGHLWIFLSHLAKHKVFASELQLALAVYGICSFVAHEDIEPDTEWQEEIEKALRTCDALVALLNEGFNESTWTDQEVGYALGRGVPVFSVRLEMAPYGLFGKKQAFNGKAKDVNIIAKELCEAYRKHPKTRQKFSDIIIDRFCSSGSFWEAKELCSQVEELEIWKPEYKGRLRDAITNNSQVKYSWGVPEKIESVILQRDPDTITNENSAEMPF